MITERTLIADDLIRDVRTQDVTADIERAKMIRENLRRGADLRHVGSIPMVLAEDWAREAGCTIGSDAFAEVIKRKLATGEFAVFATGKW